MIVALMLAALSGCSYTKSTQLEGTVTIDGVPLDYGSLSLESTSGDTSGFGSKIDQGKYLVANIVPGKFRGTVTAGIRQNVNRVAASDDGRILAERGNDTLDLQQISPNATGNNVIIEISAGDNKYDFVITSRQ